MRPHQALCPRLDDVQASSCIVWGTAGMHLVPAGHSQPCSSNAAQRVTWKQAGLIGLSCRCAPPDTPLVLKPVRLLHCSCNQHTAHPALLLPVTPPATPAAPSAAAPAAAPPATAAAAAMPRRVRLVTALKPVWQHWRRSWQQTWQQQQQHQPAQAATCWQQQSSKTRRSKTATAADDGCVGDTHMYMLWHHTWQAAGPGVVEPSWVGSPGHAAYPLCTDGALCDAFAAAVAAAAVPNAQL